MRLDNKSISLSWKADNISNIDTFTGTIRVGRIKEDDRSKRHVGHRRQVDANADDNSEVKVINFNASRLVTNYRTNDEEVSEKIYEAEVCSINRVGKRCSVPALLNTPTSGGLRDDRISPGLIAIIIAVVVVSVLVCCFIILIILIVCVCCTRDREKSYWPGTIISRPLVAT